MGAGGSHECDHCEDSFEDDKQLRTHVASVHRCQYCGNMFKDFEQVQIHAFTQCQRAQAALANSQVQPSAPSNPIRRETSLKFPYGRERPVSVPENRQSCMQLITGSQASDEPAPVPHSGSPRRPGPQRPHDRSRQSPSRPEPLRSHHRQSPARPRGPPEESNRYPGPQPRREEAPPPSYREEKHEGSPRTHRVSPARPARSEVREQPQSKSKPKSERPFVPDETLDEADAKQFEVEEGAGSTAEQHLYSRMWVVEESLETFGGSSRGTTICCEAAVQLLHKQHVDEQLIVSILENGCLMHPRPGPISFEGLYASPQATRYKTQLKCFAKVKGNTKDLSTLFEQLPKLAETSKRYPIAGVLQGASCGNILLYFNCGDCYIFDPEARVDETTKSKRGASIMLFSSIANVRAFLITLLPFVPIDGMPREEHALNAISIAIVRLHSNAKQSPSLVELRKQQVKRHASRASTLSSVDVQLITQMQQRQNQSKRVPEPLVVRAHPAPPPPPLSAPHPTPPPTPWNEPAAAPQHAPPPIKSNSKTKPVAPEPQQQFVEPPSMPTLDKAGLVSPSASNLSISSRIEGTGSDVPKPGACRRCTEAEETVRMQAKAIRKLTERVQELEHDNVLLKEQLTMLRKSLTKR